MPDKDITELFDQHGQLIGALLTAKTWLEIKPLLSPDGLKESKATHKIKEPLDDWENLKNYWDFLYPVDMDVQCSNCGNSTADWSQDTPRKFYLRAASLSGLVSFSCTSCAAKIIKKHFKDEIVVENHPEREKNPFKEGLY